MRLIVSSLAVALTLFVLACGSGGGAVNITPGAPAATAAPGATPTVAPAAAPVGKVGDRIEVGGVALTVAKVEKKDDLSQFQKAKDGNTFIVAEVLIENVGADKSPYNPLYFTIKDGDGFEYNATIDTSGPALKSGELAKGEKARGTIAVEVKKEAKGLVLQYKPIVLGGSDAIKVALP